MADDGAAQDRTGWPMPAFAFLVDFGGGVAGGFGEVAGLDSGVQAIGYRRSDNPLFSATKMPGLASSAYVTLKRGVLPDGAGLAHWLQESVATLAEPRDVTVRLRDGKGAALMTWTLVGARPVRLDGPGLKAGGDEVAIGTLELACERVEAAP